MHPAVIDFRQRLFGFLDTDAVPLPALREELLMLHDLIADEESRVELMRLFNVIADLIEVHLTHEGRDLESFRLHRHGQIWAFLRAECLVDGVIDRERLRAVTERELSAGRLSADDELRRYALGDDHAFDAYLTMH